MTEQVQEHILQKYNLVKKVGSGAYGHVWKVTDKKTNQLIALKKIFDAFQHSTDAQRTYREIVFLHELNHPNIIKLHNVIRAQNDKDLYLVFQFMQADLHNAIGQKILKDAHNRYILYQLMKGLKYMHSAQVIHRDLKPSNLLLNSDCHLKICDFGLARSLAIDKNDDKDVVLTQQVATRWYRAPQVLLGSNFYDKSADIWSVGCILAEMLVGKPVFPGSSTLNQLQKILTFTGRPKHEDIESLNSQTAGTMISEVNVKQRPLNDWFKSSVPQDAIELVVSMLSMNPKKRPTATQILNHPYLANFHKPKQEIVAEKVIHPPISDNTKLSLKEYRRLIYERIKKIYSNEKQVSKQQKQPETKPYEEIKRSVERSVGRQQIVTQPKSIEKPYVSTQINQEKIPYPSKNQSIERPLSQKFPTKSPSTEGLINNPSVFRNTKTSYSSYVPGKNGPRYSSAENQKKPVSNYISQKYSSSSSQHSSSLHQNVSDDAENTKKKNSLKEILKAKRQTTIENNFNGPVVNPVINASKSQSGFYSYNPAQSMMNSQGSGIKHSPSPVGHYAGTIQTQPKYFSYSSQFHPQQQTQYGNYTTVTPTTPNNAQYHSIVQQPYQSPVYGMHHSYQNSSLKYPEKNDNEKYRAN